MTQIAAQQALAHMLPENFKIVDGEVCEITSSSGQGCITTRKVHEREFLGIAKMVGETLSQVEQINYIAAMYRTHRERGGAELSSDNLWWFLLHASYTQRAEALSKLERFKGLA